jgi:hypothetical protein
MKIKFLAIGLLSAVIASSAVFADDMNATTASTDMNGQQQAPDTSAPTQSTTMSGTGQMSQ